MNVANTQVLLIDAVYPNILMCSSVLMEMGCSFEVASEPDQTELLIKQNQTKVLVINLDCQTQHDWIKPLAEKYPSLLLVGIIKSSGQVMQDLIESVDFFDLLMLPLELREVQFSFKRALAHLRLLEENRRYKEALENRYDLNNILGDSAMIEKIRVLTKKAAGTDISVLITGESGTGKELVARTIHNNSNRKSLPLISVNLAAIPEGLFESEMFGHLRGAFTGSVRNHTGYFERAGEGTLLLDGISYLTLENQVKLLRVLEELVIEPIGGGPAVPIKARIICNANAELELAVAHNQFRLDLFHRLNVFRIHIPPLRQRREDIPILSLVLLRKHAPEHEMWQISEAAMSCFLTYDWPGNVRELDHVIRTTVMIQNGPVITPENLPEALTNRKRPSRPGALAAYIKQQEKEMICKTLETTHGKRAEAAQMLEISLRSLSRKISEHGLGNLY